MNSRKIDRNKNGHSNSKSHSSATETTEAYYHRDQIVNAQTLVDPRFFSLDDQDSHSVDDGKAVFWSHQSAIAQNKFHDMGKTVASILIQDTLELLDASASIQAYLQGYCSLTSPQSELAENLEVEMLLIDYQVADPKRVHAFISERNEVGELLPEVKRVLLSIFGEENVLKIDVITDPEEGKQSLLITVPVSLTVPDALKKLDDFDESWWLDAPLALRQHVCVFVEYI